jgi:F-type H+-transporting ATPase subunit delta
VRQRPAAAPYAKAVFALAKERHQTELVGRELSTLAATFESDVGLRDFFARPWIPAPVKQAVAKEIAERSALSRLVSDFVVLVAGSGRTDHIEAIAQKYWKLLDDDLGRVRARVRTRVPLADEERRLMSTKLGSALRSREVVLEEVIDGTMLGGFIVESGDIVLDASLEGQLEGMRRRLAGAVDTAPGPAPVPDLTGGDRWSKQIATEHDLRRGAG